MLPCLVVEIERLALHGELQGVVVSGHGDIALVHRPCHLLGVAVTGREFATVRDDGVEESRVEGAEFVKNDFVEQVGFLCCRLLLSVDGDGASGGDLYGLA